MLMRSTFDRKKIPIMKQKIMIVVALDSFILKSAMRVFLREESRFSNNDFTLRKMMRPTKKKDVY
jgi:hypothetical protein